MKPTMVNGVDAIATDANIAVANIGHGSNGSVEASPFAVSNLKALADDDDITPTSILEFLNQEQNCLDSSADASEADLDSIFAEINRLSGDSNDRSVDELLREAEMLLSKQEPLVDGANTNLSELLKTISEESTPREMKAGAELDQLELAKVHIQNTIIHFCFS